MIKTVYECDRCKTTTEDAMDVKANWTILSTQTYDNEGKIVRSNKYLCADCAEKLENEFMNTDTVDDSDTSSSDVSTTDATA